MTLPTDSTAGGLGPGPGDRQTPQVPEELLDDLLALYQDLHAHPELSMQEERTAGVVEERMRALGYRVKRCGGTGVVAWLENGPGPVVAFRADTDALPVAEETGLPYASRARGHLPDGTEVPVMHACGHDVHVTCAIGAATLLARERDTWSGTVVLVFQPGEETAAGAAAMVADGLWDRVPRPEVVLAQHVWPGEVGTVHLSRGPAMAMADAWAVTVHGRGGHGSRPEQTIDPVLLAAHMVVRVQSVVSRRVSALDSAVVTVGTFHAGLKENIIPRSAELTLNVRTLDPEVRARVLDDLRRVLRAEAEASGAPEPTITELYRFPLLVNDPQEAEATHRALAAALGEDAVRWAPPVMGSEDVGHLAQALGVPGVYWFLGGLSAERLAEGTVPSNHAPDFAPEARPAVRAGVLAAAAALRARCPGAPGRGTGADG